MGLKRLLIIPKGFYGLSSYFFNETLKVLEAVNAGKEKIFTG